MKCPKCNATVSDNSKFCVYCGAKIETAAGSIPETKTAAVCIKCGAPLKPNAKFCVKCGAAQNEPRVDQQKAAEQQEAIKRQKAAEEAAKQQKAAEKEAAKRQKAAEKEAAKRQKAAEEEAAKRQKAAREEAIKQKKAAEQQMEANWEKAGEILAPGGEKKSKLPVIIILSLVLIIALAAGGYFVLTQVFDVDLIEMIRNDGSEDSASDGKTEETGETEETEETGETEEAEESEKGDPELIYALDDQLEAVTQLFDEGAYMQAVGDSMSLIEQYVTIAEKNNLTEEADEKIGDAFEITAKSTIEYCKMIEAQNSGRAGYDQVTSTVDATLELASSLEEKGYTVDIAEVTEYSDGIIQRFKDSYISLINEITEREQWSRDEAWAYAEQAYSIQENGKTLLFDASDLDDPLRLRYAYCLAWITTKRCENGIEDGSMTNEDAFNNMTAILEETDYNLLLLQDIMTYGSAAGKDVSGYQNAYNAIIQEIKDEQKLSIVNSGENSLTSVDVRKFWYFNDLDGDDTYKVDASNGTTQATRDWIRNNIPSYID